MMLMVGTLQCRSRNPELVELFNDFVRNQDDLLVKNNEVLKGRFMRESGVANWEGDFDAFSTSLANLYSGRLDDGGFCGMVERTAWDAGEAGYNRLLRLADSVAEAPVSGPCEVQTHYAPNRSPKIAVSDALRRSAPPLAAVQQVAVVEQVAAVEAEPESPVAFAEAEPLAAPEAEAAPAEVITAAVAAEPAPAVEAEPVAQAAVPSRDEVLRAAVAALQSAAAALQAVSTPEGAEKP